MIEALIFDLDDTLVNNAPLIKESQEVIVKSHGIENPVLPPSIIKTFFGRKTEEIVRKVLTYFSLSISPEQFIKEQDKIFLKTLDNIETMPGFSELIQYLKSCPYKLALASSGRRIAVKKKIRVVGIEKIFPVVITGDDIDDGKPNPEVFLLAAKKLSVNPKNCIVIEDADNGIKAALNAGMKIIGIQNKLFSSNQELKEAHIVIENLAQIEKTVRSFQ